MRFSSLVMVLLLCGCSSARQTKPSLPPCCRHRDAGLPAGNSDVFPPASTNASVYDIESPWQTDDGRIIHLSDLKGRVRVVSMFYAQCSGICTVTRDDLRQIEASLSRAARSRVGFVFVTFDSTQDTANALHQYRAAESLSIDRWTLLRGETGATLKLINALGIGVRRDSNGRFIHSSDIVVLDESGRILHHYNGLHADLPSINEEIEKVVAMTTAISSSRAAQPLIIGAMR